jgi:hypothetical protein
MNVYRLTIEQKNLLVGQEWGAQGQLFNPTLDADGEWFISPEEVQGCTLQQAISIGCDDWLLSLPLIPYSPIILDYGI